MCKDTDVKAVPVDFLPELNFLLQSHLSEERMWNSLANKKAADTACVFSDRACLLCFT